VYALNAGGELFRRTAEQTTKRWSHSEGVSGHVQRRWTRISRAPRKRGV